MEEAMDTPRQGLPELALSDMQHRLWRSQQLLARLAAHRDAAQDDERRRLAWVLHEELAQVLAALRMRLATVASEIGRGQPALRHTLQAMESQLDHALAAARDSVAVLRSSPAEQGLGVAVEGLVRDFRERTGVDCVLQLHEDARGLRGERATEVFRIVQEALRNVARHAKADRADVLLARAEQSYALTVRDNGNGFAADAQRGPALGLLGMRESARALGGRLRLFSARGRGTMIKLRFPVVAPEGNDNKGRESSAWPGQP
jgi:signal transduction histidine kinase